MTNKTVYPSIEVLKTAVDALKKMDEDEERWQKTFDEMFSGSWSIPSYYNVPRECIIKMIEQIFNDPPLQYGSNFSWWVYETKYGTDENHANGLFDADGNNIPMATVEDLYNYYVSRERDEQ